jgi:hypothetical protein
MPAVFGFGKIVLLSHILVHYNMYLKIARLYEKRQKQSNRVWNHYEQIIPALKIDAQPTQIDAGSGRSYKGHGSKMHARSDYCGGPDQPRDRRG